MNTSKRRLTADQQLLKDCHAAMADAIESWMKPDSPEAFCVDMKCLMNLRDRIAARLDLRHNK